MRPHLLGIDDGPFRKEVDPDVTVVGVMTEGSDLVETVAVTRLEVDDRDATERLGEWIAVMRCAPALHGVVFGGMTIGGLGLVAVGTLNERLKVPVMVVNRQAPTNDALIAALEAAGLASRIAMIEAAPPAWKLGDGLWVSHAGGTREDVRRILEAGIGKSRFPEALRLAHLIGAAIEAGESRGRV